MRKRTHVQLDSTFTPPFFLEGGMNVRVLGKGDEGENVTQQATYQRHKKCRSTLCQLLRTHTLNKTARELQYQKWMPRQRYV